jgi:hypothetical protein
MFLKYIKIKYKIIAYANSCLLHDATIIINIKSIAKFKQLFFLVLFIIICSQLDIFSE